MKLIIAIVYAKIVPHSLKQNVNYFVVKRLDFYQNFVKIEYLSIRNNNYIFDFYYENLRWHSVKAVQIQSF